VRLLQNTSVNRFEAVVPPQNSFENRFEAVEPPQNLSRTRIARGSDRVRTVLKIVSRWCDRLRMVWESRRGGRTAPSTALHGSLRKGDLLARSSRGVHSADATKPSESGPREVPVGASESSAQPGRRALERGWPQANAETRRTIPRHIRGARERGWGCARWDVRAQRDGSLGPPSATNHVTAAAPRRRGNEPEYRHGRHGRHGRHEMKLVRRHAQIAGDLRYRALPAVPHRANRVAPELPGVLASLLANGPDC
jgi:hypothetical protein